MKCQVCNQNQASKKALRMGPNGYRVYAVCAKCDPTPSRMSPNSKQNSGAEKIKESV